MTSLIPRPSLASTVVTWLALGFLAAIILGGGIALFPVSDSVARDNPEFANLRTPLLALALAICVCVEAMLVATAILVGYIRQDRIFNRAAARMVDLLVIAVMVATVLTSSLLPFIPGPPALAIMIISSVLMGITLFLVLMVLRSLLRRTVLMRVELDEVV